MIQNKRKSKEWFAVDRDGLAKILKRRGIEFAVFELIQNAWDEAGVTIVSVTLEPSSERGYAKLTILDDAPEGFMNLAHAYTLFAESQKKGNAEQRGRFNLGEKLVLALCKRATITTTKGMVVFDGEGRSVSTRTKREHGTIFEALIRMNRDEIGTVCSEVKKLIPPAGIETTFNGEALTAPTAVREFEASLPTEIADEEGALRKAWRQTTVRVYPVASDDMARIYEMGIPVVEHDCAFHVNVQQKVPVTLDRENVTPAFLRAMRTWVFNRTHDLVMPEQTTAEWAQTAIEDSNAQPEAVADYMTKRFGEHRASYDMSDPEANSKAVSFGYTLVHGGMLSGAAWQNVKRFETIQPAGQIFPTHSDNFIPFEAAELTPGMREVEAYAKKAAVLLLDCSITVQFGKQTTREAASWGGRSLSYNVRNLGEQWFDLKGNRRAIDDLLIHEFGHHYESNHLSEAYYHALTRVAAHMVELARKGAI